MSRPPTQPSRMPMLLPVAAAVAACILPVSSWAQASTAPYTVLESGRSYDKLQQAVDAIGDSRGTIAIGPGTHADCAVQNGGIVSYLATDPGAAVFDGTLCNGQAALVLRGHGAVVAGLVFQNIRAAGSAAIRLETGDLTVTESWFRDSVRGIVAEDSRGGRIVIDRVTFSRLGPCAEPEGCGHSISAGAYERLRVTRSRFEGGRSAAYVHSRAAQVIIASSSFDGATPDTATAMIVLAAEATGQISNNWFVQGNRKHPGRAPVAVIGDGGPPGDGLVVAANSVRLASGAEQMAILAGADGRDEPEANELAPGPEGS